METQIVPTCGLQRHVLKCTDQHLETGVAKNLDITIVKHVGCDLNVANHIVKMAGLADQLL